jgi:hypothetical protein
MATQSVAVDVGILSVLGLEAAQERRNGLALQSGVLALMKKAYGRPNAKVWDSGGRYPFELQVREHSTFTDLSAAGGYVSLSNTANDPGVMGYYSLASVAAPIRLGSQELLIYGSGGMNALGEAWKRKTENMIDAAYNFWSQQFVAGGVSGWTSFGTMNGADQATGYIEENAVGSQGNTVGGISKSTYASVGGWQNRVQNIADAFGSNGLNALYSLVTGANRFKAGGNKGWLCSEAGCNNLARSVQAYQRLVDGKSLDIGRAVMVFREYPVFFEPQMPTTGTATTNDPYTFLLLDVDNIFPVWSKAVKTSDGSGMPDGFFGVSEMGKEAGNTPVWIQTLHVGGQNIAVFLGTSGLAHSGETF